MITKGIIKRLNTLEDNHFLVYIPFLRKASMEESDATFEATAVYTAGIKNNYKVNDVVYLDFEDGSWDRPVIVGKLLKTSEEEASTAISCSTLEVLNNSKLLNSVSIDGMDLASVKEKLNILEQLVNTLETGGYGSMIARVYPKSEELGFYAWNLKVKVTPEEEEADFYMGYDFINS